MFFLSTCIFRSPMAAAQPERKEYPLSLKEVTELALTNNFDIQMLKYDAFIAETSLGSARSIFDVILDAEVNYQRDESKKTSSLYGTQTIDNDYNLGLSKKFASGTTVGLDMDNNRNWTDASSASSALNHNSSLSLSLTQELGKNFLGIQDRGQLDITQINVENAAYTSLEKIETLISQVQKAYWDLVLQHEKVALQRDMVAQAKKLYDIHQEKLKDGLVEMPEAIASEANYKARRNKLRLEKNILATKQNVLKLMLNLTGDDVYLIPTEMFRLDGNDKDFTQSLKIAFDHRRDYQKAQNQVAAQKIRLVMDKKNILPTINLNASLARNGLGDHFKQSVTNITDEDNTQYAVGLTFSFPLQNRDAKAKLQKSQYRKTKVLIDLKRVEKEITVDIMDQVRNCNVYKEIALNSIDVAALQCQKLTEEEKRFNTGRSDTDTVIRFQEDFIQAKQTALADQYRFHSALVDLKLKQGILLGTYQLKDK